ncbi:LLM class F420-dependent oxidoreductase [Mycolicibacter hiberniae]|uniref:LLM class F420-dependent oxidoreductase n=1 Tax=Mycolicibacter hiberniae TaxID=29314 RepID=A0A7I7X8B6_9MYCO|nr:LLM class F420-dependent oxidoreductase [Mycolicibacter hiberniae]MCV7088262.1 LLM class F420-dependent oxidoreductase [Mycolicibacter hiberniae]ORV72793.1 LLM class F420-dependent oxidoreductase [Mycolicibacter hiberniae]BBZ25117.1 LLM class F420-dependent oxidoreductase [Mycolicibacter hiberniae]
MRLGLATPVVIQIPGVASNWEAQAGAEDLGLIAAAADKLGFAYLTCSEHVAVPDDAAAGRGTTYWDPVATLSFLAARTSAIRLVPSVVVLGYHHPLEIAKRYGTLDRLSAGRLTLGVGVGSLREEFDLLDCAWEDRGARADDAMKALRASLSTERPSYAGTYYRFDSMVVQPCALQQRVPIWVGGHTRRSLRRAVDLGDGWMPFGLSGDQLAQHLAGVDLPDGFAVVLSTAPLDPIGAGQQTRDRLARLAELGATDVTCAVAARSAAHFCDQLSALAELADLPAREQR